MHFNIVICCSQDGRCVALACTVEPSAGVLTTLKTKGPPMPMALSRFHFYKKGEKERLKRRLAEPIARSST